MGALSSGNFVSEAQTSKEKMIDMLAHQSEMEALSQKLNIVNRINFNLTDLKV